MPRSTSQTLPRLGVGIGRLACVKVAEQLVGRLDQRLVGNWSLCLLLHAAQQLDGRLVLLAFAQGIERVKKSSDTGRHDTPPKRDCCHSTHLMPAPRPTQAAFRIGPNASRHETHTFACFAFPTFSEDDMRQIGHALVKVVKAFS